MDGADRAAVVRCLQRSSHWAFTDGRTLYVWGGNQVRHAIFKVISYLQFPKTTFKDYMMSQGGIYHVNL